MNLRFSRCAIADFDDYFSLRCEKENTLWTGYQKVPEKNELYDWFSRQLKRKDRLFFIVRDEENGSAVGYLYIDILGDNNEIMETGHGVSSKMKGKGIGSAIIKFAKDYTIEQLKSVKRIDGWIASDNIGSIKNVLNNGYHKTKDQKIISFEGFGQDKIMVRYEYIIEQ
ncbi:GNAT family N-acetyltransferase [Methanomethylovorans sp.]|uniref:GNAT family N-acetyltransferase n=1 Tax=Methanomethylovorans sp. TaxID=2758717 RepID=UPI003D0B83D9